MRKSSDSVEAGHPLLGPAAQTAPPSQKRTLSRRRDCELAVADVQVKLDAQLKHFFRVLNKAGLLASQAFMFTSMAMDGDPAWLSTVANSTLLVTAGVLAIDTGLTGAGLPPLVRQLVNENGERATGVPSTLRLPLSALFLFFAAAGGLSLYTPQHVADDLLPSAAVPLYTIFALLLPYVGNPGQANVIEMLQGGLLMVAAFLGAATFALHAFNNVSSDEDQLELQEIPGALMALLAASCFALTTLVNLLFGVTANVATPERVSAQARARELARVAADVNGDPEVCCVVKDGLNRAIDKHQPQDAPEGGSAEQARVAQKRAGRAGAALRTLTMFNFQDGHAVLAQEQSQEQSAFALGADSSA